MRKYILKIFVLLAVMMGTLPVDCFPAEDRDRVIIGFGDSITQGLWEIIGTPNGARVGGYEPDLEQWTDSVLRHHDVLNYGISGETTYEGLKRFKNIMAVHARARNVLILEGTNDLWDGISRQSTAWNLGKMVDKAREFGIVPIMGTLTPDARPGIGAYKNVPLYNIYIKAKAEEKNAVLVDFYAAMIDEWKSLYADGEDHNNGKGIDYLHLSRAGYAKMAELWFAALDIQGPKMTPILLLLMKP